MKLSNKTPMYAVRIELMPRDSFELNIAHSFVKIFLTKINEFGFSLVSVNILD